MGKRIGRVLLSAIVLCALCPVASLGDDAPSRMDLQVDESIVCCNTSDTQEVVSAIEDNELGDISEITSSENMTIMLLDDTGNIEEAECEISENADNVSIYPNISYTANSVYGTRGGYSTRYEQWSAYASMDEDIDYVTSQLLVGYSSSMSESLLAETIASVDGTLVDDQPLSDMGISIAQVVLPEGANILSAIGTLEACNGVLYAEPNMIRFMPDTSSYDAGGEYAATAAQYYLDSVHVREAWNYSKCSNQVSVAVLDTGIDGDHPDLTPNILASYAWDTITNSSLDADAEDVLGHGTHVAGIIAGVADNGFGIDGVSYNANIVPVKVFDDDGLCTDTNLIEGIDYVISIAEDADVRVINMSLGGESYSTSLELAVNNAVANGVLVVCSAGNENTDASKYPSDFDSVISVVATDAINNRWTGSNYGLAKDIAAPGVRIMSTLPGDYEAWTGTSMAAPIVSSVAALLYAYNPNLTCDQVKNILYSTAQDLGDSGRDQYYGWGLVNAEDAISIAMSDFPVGKWNRIYGETRYETANAAAREGWSRSSCDVVIVASGNDFPDALSATSLAGVYGCPVLLVDADSEIPSSTAAEIHRLGAEEVVVAGGTSAVSDMVFSQLEQIVGTGNVRRLSGSDRHQTCSNIYNAGAESWSDTCIVVRGYDSCVDAVSIAPYAFASKSPIFLAQSDGSISDDVKTTITNGEFSKAIVIGGDSAVAQSAEQWLMDNLGSDSVIRLSGEGRVETSATVARWETGSMTTLSVQPDTTLGYDKTVVINAWGSFADGLTGGALAGSANSVLVQATVDSEDGGVGISQIVRPNLGQVTRGRVMGGTATVPASFLAYLNSL